MATGKISETVDRTIVTEEKIKEFLDYPSHVANAPLYSVAAAAIIASADSAYKRFFSQAAKACKGKSGKEKTICMNNYKRKGKEQQLRKLQSSISKCSKDKNPDKCRKRLTKKINSIKLELSKI